LRREHVVLETVPIGRANLIAYGHFGRPVLVFPSDSGRAWDFESNGLLESVRSLVEDGRAKLYCVDSFEAGSWRRDDIPLEQRAREHERFEQFVLNDVVPWIFGDCGGPQGIVVTGCSFGAYHAANFTLRRGDVFPQALCLSGAYDLSKIAWGEAGDTFYFHNPLAYVANLDGDHLGWLRSTVHLTLVVGSGQWEDDSASGALPSTLRLARLLEEKRIPHELDVWGPEAAHDWPWWQRQLAYHLPRLCPPTR
jgi:esterase/lipase superfamily enzyme